MQTEDQLALKELRRIYSVATNAELLRKILELALVAARHVDR